MMSTAARGSPSAEEVAGSVHCLSPEEDTGHSLLLHSPVELRSGYRRQKRHLFLFSDLLLISNTKYKKTFKIKGKTPLVSMWMAHCTDKAGKASRASQRSFILGWPMMNFVATFSSSELKEKWHSFLQRYIDLAKDKEQPKNLPIKIFTEDNNCAPSITITVTNSDTANDIINGSLARLGVTGSERDYQLCVSSSKGKDPRPLIGHEHPYAIQKSNLPATVLEDSTTDDTQETREIPGQFILKPRHPDSGQKAAKRRSFTEWLFRRGPRTGPDNRGTTTTPVKPRPLFGASLDELCDDGKLPAPILEMLVSINEKGPDTKGIFRKSANMKSCRRLQDKLNARDTLDLDNVPVLVTASVLKDFLRNVEGSVLPSSVYEKWLALTDEGNEEEKIAAAQRLLEQLPRANEALLRHLFAALHNIQQHSSENHMTPYNLSVCIAPSLLCLPDSDTDLELKDLTKKVALVQFLIENYPRIFARDSTRLLEESSPTGDNSEEAAGSKHPNDIQESHVPHTVLLPQEPEDTTTSSTQGPRELPDLGQEAAEKLDPIDLLFHGEPRTGLESRDTTPTPVKPRPLFGASLDELCDDGKLPAPILEMLASINEKGPYTRGIFRKSVDMKSCTRLKDKLNARDTLDLDNVSVLVTASVLKDFLRNVEGSVLPSNVYEKWIALTDEGNEEEKIAAAQRLLEQLPQANEALLRHLFTVLHNIQQHSSENHMTPYNLSFCVASSILCRSASDIILELKTLTKKVALVQFLIENYPRIFARDSTRLLEESSPTGDNSEEAAGSKHPNDIQESHVPHTVLLPQEPEDTTTSSTQGPRELPDSGQKAAKRRSFIEWLLCRGPHTGPDSRDTTPTPVKPRPLFGASLDELCDDGKLPAPILEMLASINEKGPDTKGIFRKSANMKFCRRLKDKLNARDTLDLDNVSVLVTASVLKDFLRNVEGSVLPSNVYEKWIALTDEGNEEEKIAAAQRLLEQLPRANEALLRHLFAVLHNIQQHSSENHMTPHHLSFCVASSILCRSASDIILELKDLTKKVALVQFLIENYPRIFARDSTRLLEESSPTGDNSEEAAVVTTKPPLEPKPVSEMLTYRTACRQDEEEAPAGRAHPTSSLGILLHTTEDKQLRSHTWPSFPVYSVIFHRE